ncbi:putative T7SS-secreted protein [Streptomyces sp. NPDC023327]|uniref:putative T7SS-secreted protein n=1 Tax=Streptomyces sp. NPDC023327 TaxID=3157088 RepID=UPI0033D10E4E
MTYAPGAGTDPFPDSPARRNGPLPQGLKSAPDIPNPDFPDLGFNPAPGSPATVKALHKKLAASAKTLDDTHEVVTKLMDGSYWAGDAAVAFREQLEGGRLPKDLRNAAHSLAKAARQLHRWHDELDDFRSRAKRLNDDAKAAREALEKEKGRADTAGRDPDLKGEGGRLDDAKKALSRAEARVTAAQDELDRILRRARGLAYEHEEKAGLRAGRIRAATKHLAPHEPGCFDKAMEWIEENLPDILAAVAGVIGLAAIILAGPLGAGVVAALLLASSALGAGALGLRLTQDHEMWASLQDGVTKGEFDSDFWSNVVTLGSDALGALPGLTAVTLGTRGAVGAMRAGGEVLTLGQRLAGVGSHTMEQARAITSLDNVLVTHTVRAAVDPARAAKAVAVTTGSLGVGTAGFGLVNSAVDADDDGIKDGAVAGIDGARLGLDSGGVLNLARHAFS